MLSMFSRAVDSTYLLYVLDSSSLSQSSLSVACLVQRKSFVSSSRNSLLKIVAIAAAGSGFLYANCNSNYKTRVSLSIPAQLRESGLLPWQFSEVSMQQPLSIPAGFWNLGDLWQFSSRVSPEPAGYVKKEVPFEVGDDAKPCSRCLGRDSIANAGAKVGPAVVNLSVPQGFYGIAAGKSVGSGTIIDADGTILTCAHVVADFQGMRPSSKAKVGVTLQDGRTFEGTIVNADLHSDIAIVKIKSKTPLPAAELGSSSKLHPGDCVLSLGCPLSLQNTVTAGVGNLGGPLVNVGGEIVGINIMKVIMADGLGFAVPIDSVIKIIEHFKKSGRVIRPWLGFKMLDLNDMIIAQLKERDVTFSNVKKGVLVTPGSPADRAGFHPGDAVIEFDGKPVESIKEIIEMMSNRIGKAIKVVVKRANDETAILTVIPEEANPDM
ncbi:hypothetical protein SLA2020_213160 [Shorea laevis]